MKTIHTLVLARERSKAWYNANKNKLSFIENRRARTLKWRENNPHKYLLQHAKTRAKDRNVPFDLSEEDIEIPDVCPVFKTQFVYGTPMSMSVDRIEPDKGYIKGNVQVISWKANMMKQDATKEQLRKFAEWVNQSTR